MIPDAIEFSRVASRRVALILLVVIGNGCLAAANPQGVLDAVRSDDHSYALQLPGIVTAAAFSPDGAYLAVAGNEAKNNGRTVTYSEFLNFWDVAKRTWATRNTVRSGVLTSDLHNYVPTFRFMQYSTNGQQIIVDDGDDMLRIFDSRTLREERAIPLGLPAPPRYPQVVDMQVSRDGHRAAVLIAWLFSVRGVLRIFDLQTGLQVREWVFDGEEFMSGNSVAISPDGQKIALTLPDVDIDASTGRSKVAGLPGLFRKKKDDLIILSIEHPTAEQHMRTDYSAGPVAFASDTQVITVSEDRDPREFRKDTIKIWTATTGKLVREIETSPDGVRHRMDLSLNGSRIVGYVGSEKYNSETHGNDTLYQRFRVWDFTTGKPIFTSPDILPILISPPRLIISPKGDKVVAYWTIGTSELQILDIP